MSYPVTTTTARHLKAGRRTLLDRWIALTHRQQSAAKVVFLVGSLIAAYNYSLRSLLGTISVDTPLAYVGLVPVFAGCLAWLLRHPRPGEPDIHDRQLDYILGVPLVGVALLMDLVLPVHMGDLYWVERVDLLSLPILVAGSVTLLFGTRVAWRQKFAIAYLFLAWPWPYTTVLLGTLGGFTSLTLHGLNGVLELVPVAKTVPGSVNSGLYEVVHAGHIFPVSVVTACSGVDGMVGFLLVGVGFAAIVAGPLGRKVAWLAVGMALLWTTNLIRLLLIFEVGRLAGEHVAIGIVHPVAGIILFCVGVMLMMVLLRPFGLSLADRIGPAAASVSAPTSTPSPGARRAAPRVFLSAGILLAVCLVATMSNLSLRSFDPVANAAGEARISSYLAHPASPAGWTSTFETEFTINKPLFGQSSRWFRYLYSESPGRRDLSASLPVTADVIDAASLSGFEEYGVTACYSFHGYELRDVANVGLGSGISGQALSYASPSGSEDWSIVYWIWPVTTTTGTRWERVILYLQNTAAGTVTPPHAVPGVSGISGALGGSADDRRLARNRAFLVAFAREIVARQVVSKAAPVDVATVTGGTQILEQWTQAEIVAKRRAWARRLEARLRREHHHRKVAAAPVRTGR